MRPTADLPQCMLSIALTTRSISSYPDRPEHSPSLYLSLKRLMAGTGELITLTVANDDQHQSEPAHTQQQQLTGTDRSVAGHHNRFSAMLLANHYAVG